MQTQLPHAHIYIENIADAAIISFDGNRLRLVLSGYLCTVGKQKPFPVLDYLLPDVTEENLFLPV